MQVTAVSPEEPVRASVLLVDDVPANLFALEAVLRSVGARLVQAGSGQEALDLVAREQFAVVLLDVQMPGMDGFEVSKQLRLLEHGRELPIIFLTAIHRDESFAKQGYASGAADYITKPFDIEIVRARVKAFVDLFEQRENVRRQQVGARTRERDEAIRRLVAFEQIASAALDTNDLSLFLDQLLQIFMGAADAADSARIFLRDGEELTVHASVGVTGDEATSAMLGEGFVGAIAGQRMAAELVEREQVRYGVPLLHEGEVLGVAYLGSRRAKAFPEVEKRLFQTLSERASWAVATQLKRSRLHDVLMAAPAMISIVRAPSMIIELANPGFRALFNGRELVGRHVSETGLGASAIAVLEEALASEKIIAFDELAVTGDFSASGEQERRWFRFTAQPLRNSAGTVDSVLTFAFDVTQQVEARRLSEAHEAEKTELLRRETAARAAAEVANQAKDAFLATVSHELRTPLNAILGWTVTARAKAPPELDRALGIVERNARSQARIIEDVLDISRIVSGRLRLDVGVVQVRDTALAALESVRPAADAKSISLAMSGGDDLPTITADQERLQQVIWNLLANAIKFTPKGGAVALRLAALPEAVRIEVSDSGEGIEEKFLPYVFEPFRQADETTTRRHSGLGLGLAIVQQLVQAHGGTITARSAGAGAGATFEVTLPLGIAVQPEEAEAVLRASSAPPKSRIAEDLRLDGLKILVVDDEEDARLLLRDVLCERGATVAEAGSARDGFEELERFRPDVIVSDIAMPGGDGYGLIRAVRKLGHDRGGRTPAIALTAHARAQDGERAFAAGFQRYASKPVDLEHLIAMVANLCGISFSHEAVPPG